MAIVDCVFIISKSIGYFRITANAGNMNVFI
jgi:hypothetical protein